MLGVGIGIRHLHREGTVGGTLDVGEEGVLLLRIGRDGSDQLDLALPFSAADAVRDGQGQLAVGKGRIRIQGTGPVSSGEPGAVQVETLEEVRAIGIAALIAAAGIVVTAGLVGDDELPGDGAAAVAGRGVPHQRDGLGGEFLDDEMGVLHEVVVGDVREVCTRFEHQADVLTHHFEAVRGLLDGCRSGVVRRGVALGVDVRLGRHADVDIDGAGRAGIEGVVTVRGEGELVVIDAEVGLVVLRGLPPAGGVVDALAAGHMGLRVAVDVPGSLGEDGVVLVEADQRVVDVESLLDIVRGHAGRVHDVHADGVVAGFSKDLLVAVAGVVLAPALVRSLEDPDGNDGLGVHGEGNLVGLLVYRDDGLKGRRIDDLTLGRVVDFLLGAGENQDGGRENVC